MNLPIWLTLFRLVLIPFVVGLMFVPMSGFNIAAAILYLTEAQFTTGAFLDVDGGV